MRFVASVLLFLIAFNASAVPVRWELPPAEITSSSITGFTGLNLDDPLPRPIFSMNGSFVYDADLGQFSDIDIVVTYSNLYLSGYGRSGSVNINRSSCMVGSTSTCPAASAVTFFTGYPPTENTLNFQDDFLLTFNAPLTNAGGAVSLASGYYHLCDRFEGCDGIDASEGGIGAPPPRTIIGTVVPIPAAVWLLASGLGLLGWFRRRTIQAHQVA